MSSIISKLLIFYLFIFHNIESYNIPENHNTSNSACNDYGKYSIFSWGISQYCCDFYPRRISISRGHEAGGFSDSTYSKIKKITEITGNNTSSSNSGSSRKPIVIYMSVIDFPLFLPVFLSYPSTTRIILVTGLNDIG